MTSLDEADHRLFAAVVERIADARYDIDRCRSGEMECEPEEWLAFAEQGLLALGIDPRYGGVGGGAVDMAMVMRLIGRNLLALPFLDTVIVAATLIGRLGSEEQRQKYLPAIANGALRLSLAHREADAGDARDHVGTRAQGGRLTGEKNYVFDPVRAHNFIVSARDEHDALRLYLVNRDQSGLAIQTFRLPDNRLAAHLTLNAVEGEALDHPARDVLPQVMELACACLAAEAVGAIEALNRDTLAYAKMRRQFGVPIGSFQVIQHRLVNMFIAEQVASALVTDALRALDDGRGNVGLMASAAKAQADRAARFVGESAIQIHGGMGMTDECSVGHHLKRVLTIGSRFGTAHWHLARLGALTA